MSNFIINKIRKSVSGRTDYIMQRITAIMLIPLSLWFCIFIVKIVRLSSAISYSHSNNDNQLLFNLIGAPWNIAAAIGFVLLFLYHGALGMKVIIDDYIHCLIVKQCSYIILFLVSILSVIAGVVAIIYIASHCWMYL